MINKEKTTIQRKKIRNIALVIAIFLAISSFLGSLVLGSTSIDIMTILNTIKNPVLKDMDQIIVWTIRVPRSIVAFLVGASLAISGAILQAVMKNPLADPQIVGVSAGAGLAGVVILILVPEITYLVPLISFIGALLAAIAVYALAWKRGIRPTRIILAGVAVSAFLGSGISALMVFFSDRVQGALLWMVGGFSAISWNQVQMIWPYAVLGILLAFVGSKQLTILSLGDERAKTLGMSVELVRFIMTAIAAFLAAVAVSVSGLIGFVGLITPHIVRLFTGNDYRYIVIISAFLGGAIILFSDTLGRILFSPVEIPVGIIMAFFGGPFFLYILRRNG